MYREYRGGKRGTKGGGMAQCAASFLCGFSFHIIHYYLYVRFSGCESSSNRIQPYRERSPIDSICSAMIIIIRDNVTRFFLLLISRDYQYYIFRYTRPRQAFV